MRKAPLAALALAALVLSAVRVRADGVGVNEIGRYRPLAGNTAGLLDQWSGTIYFTDPSDSKKVVVVDFPAAHYAVHTVESGKGSWDTPPTLTGGGLPDAKGTSFVQVGEKLEVLDTRNGDHYALEGAGGKAADWKDVKVRLLNRVVAKEVSQPLKKG